MSFESHLEEAYAGFGQAGHLNTTDLRTLYYGRPDIYVSFTDDGEYEIEAGPREIDRPDAIVCYDVRDVIGRKVSSNEFYANVFRLKKNKGEFIEDVRRYRKEDLFNDVTVLRSMEIVDRDTFEDIWNQILRDSTIRHHFVRMWLLTEFIAKERNNRYYGILWRQILLSLGYVGFSDPSKAGILMGGRDPVTLYIDFDNREDLDILPIQRFRQDPRRRVADRVERKVKRISARRNRVAKRRT